MESSSSETDSSSNPNPNPNPNPNFSMSGGCKSRKKSKPAREKRREPVAWPRKGKGGGNGGVALEGYVGAEAGDAARSDGGGGGGSLVGRTKSLTDEDLEELKGCLDLGFGFSYHEIPELCNTLPALELCYSMSQRYLDDQHQHQHQSRSPNGLDPLDSPASSSPIANWRISGPGDNPDEVKARLKYWAQAVACTVRLCS